MTDEKIKEEFDKWVPGDATTDEFDFIESINDPSWQCEAVGFYAGFRAAERLAKIEVLEDIERAIMAMEYPNNNPEELRIRDVIGYVEQQIKLLKAGR